MTSEQIQKWISEGEVAKEARIAALEEANASLSSQIVNLGSAVYALENRVAQQSEAMSVMASTLKGIESSRSA